MGGKTSNESKRKYNEKAYDRIQLVVKKGTKTVLQDIAKNNGTSINCYIKTAVQEQYKADTGNDIEL